FERLGQRDVDGALALMAPDATVRLQGLGVAGTMADAGRAFLESLVQAFPDLYLRVRTLFVTTEGVAVAEVTVEGTQAADLGPIVNLEKHMARDQVWMLHMGDDGLVHDARAYWCEVQLYRRLGVKRLDHVTITAV